MNLRMRAMLRVFQTSSLIGSSLSAVPVHRIYSQRAFSLSNAVFESGRMYTKKHEWILLNDAVGTVGISQYAQASLGDVVYVETPEVGVTLTRGEPTGAVESVKAASDVYAPISGEVIEVNSELSEKPFLINKSTYDKGWLYKLKLSNKEELKDLMDENAYEAFCKEEHDEN